MGRTARLASVLTAAAIALGASAGMAQEPQSGGTLNLIVQLEPPILMLGLNQQDPPQYVAGKIYEPLLIYDKDLNPQPWLAREYEISDDGLTYTFHQREILCIVGESGSGKSLTVEDAPLVLTVQKLDKVFRTGRSFSGLNVRTVHAVKAVDLEVRRGEMLGIVGESGSGKSTAARFIVRLVKPDSGSVVADGTDIPALSSRAFRPFRKRIQMIFQDPYASLNPRYKVGRIISENPIIHGMDRAQAHPATGLDTAEVAI
jgi:ABC-type dipeptide/oligopeptide/nickel transport system ATPase component